MGGSRTMTDGSNAHLVSVIMPLYNAERFVQRSMQSVLSQTHAKLELIVVDDGSVDASFAMASAIAATDARVRLFRNDRNLGVAGTRNRALDAATGRYIAFLDSDDRWHADKLQRQLAAMASSGAPISYGTYERVDEDGHSLGLVVPPASLSHRDMLRSNRIGHCTGIYDRDAIGDGHRFLPIGHEDYAFWLGLLQASGPAIAATGREPLAYYLVRGGSISSNKLRAAKWQWCIYREHQDMGLVSSTWYMTNYAALAVLKRRARRGSA